MSRGMSVFSFVFCSDEEELQALFARFKSEFSVKGGGRGNMLQGTVEAQKEALEKFF
jgi:hypothetical protein